MGIRMKWDGDMRFVSTTESGASVTLEPGPAFGGTGKYPTPMELLAIGLGACTGMDIVSILEKMRVGLKKLDIEVETKRREEHPRYYEEMKITYVVSGDDLTEEKARKAADLSNEKYCSVGVMLREKAKIEYDVKVV
ncbi:MAG: OsmC family protein [Candidatus Eisenbacteria bacterium]